MSVGIVYKVEWIRVDWNLLEYLSLALDRNSYRLLCDLCIGYTVKPVLSVHSKIDKKKS